MTSRTEICKNCKKEFTIDAEDTAFYERMAVPPPTRCPDCRAIRRLTWWNEHNLYRNQGMFSTYPEHSPIKIYDHDYWWSDGWDAMDYGRDYDFKRPFFDSPRGEAGQFNELACAVPRSAREIKSLEDSDYSDNSSHHLKHCYLCFDSDFNDNCMYGNFFRSSKDTLDVTNADHDELCYEIFVVDRSYQCAFSTDLDNCRNVWFSRNCEDCEHCFGCANLRHKKYCFFNEQLTKEEYERRVKELNLGSYAALQKTKDAVKTHWQKFPYKFMHGTHNTGVTGDYVSHSKDIVASFETYESQRVRYSQRIVNHSSEVWDSTSWGDNSELIYETVVCGENNRNVRFCAFCWPANRDIEYCIHCHSSANLFGCVGLRKKEYCILNKQYTRDEYEALIAKIKIQMTHDKEYGEFFPTSMSPFAYNETVAMDYFPLTKEEALKRGFTWRDPEAKEFKITMTNNQIPDNIKDTNDQITKEIIECATCKKAYRILDRELEFYQRLGVPLPRLCHNCRHTERLKLRNPMRLYDRTCAKCKAPITTTYSPERPEIVYCETCYQQEIA